MIGSSAVRTSLDRSLSKVATLLFDQLRVQATLLALFERASLPSAIRGFVSIISAYHTGHSFQCQIPDW